MDKYMLTIMVTFEQEYAIQKLFGRHGWEYSKITDEISLKKENSVEKASSEPQPPVNQQSTVKKTVTVPSNTSKIVTSNNDKVTKTAAVKISVISDVNHKLDNSISSEADPLGDDDHDEEGDEDDDYGGDTDTEHAEQSLESLGIVVKEEVDSEEDKTCENGADNISSSASKVKISGKGKRVAQTKVVTSNRKKRKLATCTVTSAEAEENVDRGEREFKLEQLPAEDQDIEDSLAVLETLPDIEHLSKVVSSETHDVETFLTGPSDIDDSGYSFTLAAYFCKDCQYTFPEEKYFTIHKRSGKCVFQCQFCDKKYTFKTFSSYQEHLKQHRHETDSPFINDLDEELELSFIEAQETENAEEIEGIEGSFMEVAEEEAKQSSTSALKCTYCRSSFQQKSKLKEHKDRVHRGYICEVCGTELKTRNALRRHRVLKHQVEDAMKYTCPYEECKRIFVSKPFLEDHINSHLKNAPHKCTKCDKTFGNRYKKNAHSKSCGQTSMIIPCPACDRTFSSTTNLQIHRTSVHEHKTYACDFCGSVYKYITGLMKHKQQKKH